MPSGLTEAERALWKALGLALKGGAYPGASDAYAAAVGLNCTLPEGPCKEGAVVLCNFHGSHTSSTRGFAPMMLWEFFDLHPKPAAEVKAATFPRIPETLLKGWWFAVGFGSLVLLTGAAWCYCRRNRQRRYHKNISI